MKNNSNNNTGNLEILNYDSITTTHNTIEEHKNVNVIVDKDNIFTVVDENTDIKSLIHNLINLIEK